MDLSYIDWLAFTSPMVQVFTLLVRIILAAPLVVSVFISFMRCAVCTLDGLIVLLYSRCMACKEEPKNETGLFKHNIFLMSHLMIISDVLVSILSVFLATLKMERRESTSNR